MQKQINWGILGTGNIANRFTESLKVIPNATIAAVGSRSSITANAFANKYGIKKSYASYQELVNDPDVDIIYISTPQSVHYENTLLCLNAGKHVLCEKPLALNTNQVKKMIGLAKTKNLFLMEAMWMWFIPAIRKAKELIDAGEIGDPRLLSADFGFYIPFDPDHRLFSPELGGGALLDIGIYPLALSLMMFGKPDLVAGEAIIGKTGVDEQITMSLQYDDEKSAYLAATLKANSPCEAIISGSKGYLRFEKNFWRSQSITLTTEDGQEEKLYFPTIAEGFEYEAMHAMACLNKGLVQSDIMSWQASLDLIEMMDSLRKTWGVRYLDE
jgi:predicted dehydrogenase